MSFLYYILWKDLNMWFVFLLDYGISQLSVVVPQLVPVTFVLKCLMFSCLHFAQNSNYQSNSNYSFVTLSLFCRVLLRVRLLYYLKQEVIGAEEEKVFLGKHYSEIDIPPPLLDGEVPCGWWDEDADKSLLIGTHKHGKKIVKIHSRLVVCS